MRESEAARWLLERDRFLILTHVRPDGDTLGCAAALCAALRQKGKTAWAAPNPGVTETYLGDIQPYFAPMDYAPEHIVAVDIATEGLFPDALAPYKGRVELCIDHHPSNSGYAQNTCLDASAAACGEIVYRICRDGLGTMDAEIARSVYLAISTDTGCFVYGNTTPTTHRIAAQVMEYGDFFREINRRCFQTKSRKRLELESRLLQSAHYYEEGRVVIGGVSLADMAQVGASEADSEELSSLLRQVEGVQAAATLRELAPDQWKLSLRTDVDYLNATDTCALLGGGGHAAAAGATVSGTDREGMERRVLEAIRTVLNGR
ncbi:MAG: DHH family phosphoesterase [Clostridiales bacterium]|nr:DHH family phosphoesterase [Clostridiales bacterium]